MITIENKYKNLGYFFLILLLFVIGGFYKTYFGLFPKFNERTTLIVHFHVTVLMLWVVLLIVQPLLIRAQKFEIHRLLGKFSYVLVPLIILSAMGMLIEKWNRHVARHMPLNENLKTLTIGVSLLILFTTFYSLAIWNRKNVTKHMRYMIATGLTLILPSFGRFIFRLIHMSPVMGLLSPFFLTDFILLALIIFDKKNGKDFKPYLIALILFLIFQAVILIWGPV